MQTTLDLRLNLKKNNKNENVLLFCTNYNHQPSWKGLYIPGFVTLGFCEAKSKQL
jgi:hypothetical protein